MQFLEFFQFKDSFDKNLFDISDFCSLENKPKYKNENELHYCLLFIL